MRGSFISMDDLDLDAICAMADDALRVEDVGEYGYGGEIFPHYEVTNLFEVVCVVARAVLTSPEVLACRTRESDPSTARFAST